MTIPENLKGRRLTAFFTDRTEGVRKDVLSAVSGFPEDAVYMPVQRHTDRVLVLDGHRRPEVADAVVSSVPGVLIGVRVADCVPILLYDCRRDLVGTVHAGWRGTAGRILIKTIETMADGFSSRIDDIVIAFGPAIRGCCYVVGEDVASEVRAATGDGDYIHRRGGTVYLDLVLANRTQALSTGIPEGNIWMSEECTYCLPGRFFSFRYSGTAERQGGFIGLRDRAAGR
ncbi:MAG: peptidoglycan editing factor PgeF [Nitrospirae bacterium]|nr:peptidoglycan editing factor PgeF [Nitrospirota bacterium]